MREIIVSMPKSMSDWFAQCMYTAGHKCNLHGASVLRGQPIHMYAVQNMTIEEVHLLLKTYIQTRVNVHEIQASL
jgi:hypothetical protein